MKTDLFQSCGHCWVFQICWHIECNTFTASSSRIWNSSTGIPLPPLALFIVKLLKVHLTLDSRMSGSRWVITPLWLSVSWRWAVATGLGKVSFHSNPKKGNAKECSNYHTIALISHASDVMLKIFQARLQQYVNPELRDVQAGFRKGKNQISNCQHPLDHGKSKRVPEKHFCFIDYAKAFDCVDHNKVWKILKEMGYQATWHDSWETYMQVRKQHLELYMEHILVPNRKRSMSRLYIVTLLV